MMQASNRKFAMRSVTVGFDYIAVWQGAVFLLLVLLVWVNERFDFAAMFGAAPMEPNFIRGCLASAGVLIGAIIAIGNTYLQQRRIVGGLLTMCSYCKKVRIEQELWQRVEEYIGSSKMVDLTHGICPGCMARMQEEIGRVPASGAAPKGGGGLGGEGGG